MLVRHARPLLITTALIAAFTLVGLQSAVAGRGEGPRRVESQARTSAVSYSRAKSILLKKVIKPSGLAAGDSVIAFRWKRALKKGTRIAAYRDGGKTIRLKRKTWFFWVDDDPKAQFEHANRFVLIDAISGRLRVIKSQWWPTVNGKNPYLSPASYWQRSNWAYGNLTPPAAATATTATAGASTAVSPRLRAAASTAECAVIIAGSNHARAGFLDDVDGMERAITALKHTTTKIKPPAANGKAEFEAAVKAAITDGCKNVLLYIASHGSKESVTMGSGSYTAADMKKLIEANPTVTFKVVIQACKSGSWIEPLKDKVEIIETATDSTKSSYSANPDTASDPNPADKGSEFTSGLVEDLELIPNSPVAQIFIQQCMMGFPPLISGKPPLVCQLEWAYRSAVEKDEDAAAGNETPQKHQR